MQQTRFQSMSDNIVTKNILIFDTYIRNQSSLHARVYIAKVGVLILWICVISLNELV